MPEVRQERIRPFLTFWQYKRSQNQQYIALFSFNSFGKDHLKKGRHLCNGRKREKSGERVRKGAKERKRETDGDGEGGIQEERAREIERPRERERARDRDRERASARVGV